MSIQLEQRILETIRVLAPEKQEAVLAFAESLQGEKVGGNNGLVDLASRGIGIEQSGEVVIMPSHLCRRLEPPRHGHIR